MNSTETVGWHWIVQHIAWPAMYKLQLPLYRGRKDYASIALQYDPESFQTETCLGEIYVCACGAFRFPGDPTSICCANGQVRLQEFPHPPEYLKWLYDGHHPHSKHFLENV